MIEGNRYRLHNHFSNHGQEVEAYLQQVYINSISFYRNNYSNRLHLTESIEQDADALYYSFGYLEDYLFYYDQFYPQDFKRVFDALKRKLNIITVLPKKRRGIYGEFVETHRLIFINPALVPSTSLTGQERTRLYMCHELGHIINSDWMNTVVNHISSEATDDLQLIYDGFAMIDEATTQNRAEAITYYFCGKQRGELRRLRSSLFDGQPFKSNFDYYGEFQEPAIAFSKTLRGSGGPYASDDDAMRLLSVRTLDPRFVDKVFYEYQRDGHLSDLIDMLKNLGRIKNGKYASFGIGDRSSISETRLAKENFMRRVVPLFDSRQPFNY